MYQGSMSLKRLISYSNTSLTTNHTNMNIQGTILSTFWFDTGPVSPSSDLLWHSKQLFLDVCNLHFVVISTVIKLYTAHYNLHSYVVTKKLPEHQSCAITIKCRVCTHRYMDIWLCFAYFTALYRLWEAIKLTTATCIYPSLFMYS